MHAVTSPGPKVERSKCYGFSDIENRLHLGAGRRGRMSPPLQRVSAEEFKRAKREETRCLGLQGGGEEALLPAGVGQMPSPGADPVRDAANKAQRGAEMTNLFATSSSQASGGEGPGL